MYSHIGNIALYKEIILLEIKNANFKKQLNTVSAQIFH